MKKLKTSTKQILVGIFMVIAIIILLVLLNLYKTTDTFFPATSDSSSLFQDAVKIATIDSNSGVQAFMTDLQWSKWPNNLEIVRESDTVMYGIFVQKTSTSLTSNSLFLTKITNNIANTNRLEIYNPPDELAMNVFIDAIFQTDTNIYIYVELYTHPTRKHMLVTVNKANPVLDANAVEVIFPAGYTDTISTFKIGADNHMVIRIPTIPSTFKLYKVSADFKLIQFVKDIPIPAGMNSIGRIYYLESSQKYLALGDSPTEVEGLDVMSTSTDLSTWSSVAAIPAIFTEAYWSIPSIVGNNVRTKIELYAVHDQYLDNPRIEIYKVELNTNVNLCTGHTYSDWGSCIDGQRTRTVLSSTPANCTGGLVPVLSESCTVSEGVVCGPLDVNGDTKVTPVDFSAFLSIYGSQCSDTAPTTGCKGKDSNTDNRISPVDLSNILAKYGLPSCL